MFGQGYHRVESAVPLAAGVYEAKITRAEIVQGNYGQQAEVRVEIDGHPNCQPSRFWLKDAPTAGNNQYSQQELLEFWCRTMTKFFDSFGIRDGDFNTASWVNRSGRITVRPQKNKPQYMEIVPYETTYERQDAGAQGGMSQNGQAFVQGGAQEFVGYAQIQQTPPNAYQQPQTLQNMAESGQIQQGYTPNYQQGQTYQQQFGSANPGQAVGVNGFPEDIPF